MGKDIEKCNDISIINGHIVLPEVMAPDAEFAKSLIRAGRALEVQAEIERRAWLRSPEGQAYVASIPVEPMSDEDSAACAVAYAAQKAAEKVACAKGRARELARINRRRAAAGLPAVLL